MMMGKEADQRGGGAPRKGRQEWRGGGTRSWSTRIERRRQNRDDIPTRVYPQLSFYLLT